MIANYMFVLTDDDSSLVTVSLQWLLERIPRNQVLLSSDHRGAASSLAQRSYKRLFKNSSGLFQQIFDSEKSTAPGIKSAPPERLGFARDLDRSEHSLSLSSAHYGRARELARKGPLGKVVAGLQLLLHRRGQHFEDSSKSIHKA